MEGYKGKPVRIQLEDDHRVFRCPYRLRFSKRDEVKLRCKELLNVGLIGLSDGEYAFATVMPIKKDVFGIWMEKHMYGDYCSINRKTKSN